MRSSDFSKAPPVGQAGAMFVGATRYRGPHSWIMLTLNWMRMVRMIKRFPGYRWHKVYWEFPFTLGTLAFFDDRDSLMRFARSKYHRRLMLWVTGDGRRWANGGYIRVYIAEPQGYTNGVWRAEADEWGHIERFTATGSEAQGPYVDPALTRAAAIERAASTDTATDTDAEPGDAP